MILVTGSTGLVGSHLLYHLTKQGHSVRALYRSEDKIVSVKHVFSYYEDAIDALFSKIEWTQGNINDIPSLETAFKDISYVYHCAALVSFNPDDYYKLRKANIKGTANIVNFCISHAVKKLCYVSSIAAIGENSKNKLITESTEWNPELDHSVYAITKYGAEMEVWRGTQEGLDAVVVNPGIIIGAGYWKTSSGSIFKRIYKGLKYYPTGISGYVDIHDVVGAMIQLMKSSLKNERYILVAENLSFKDFATAIAKNLKVTPPQKEATPFILSIAWRMDWLTYFFKKKYRNLTKQMARSITTDSVYSNEKILKGLTDFEFTAIDNSIENTSKLFLKDH